MRRRQSTVVTATLAWSCAASLAGIAAPAAAGESIAAAALVVDAGPDDTAEEGQVVDLRGVVTGDGVVATS